MEFCFSGKVTLEDFIQFNEFHTKKSIFRKLRYILYLFIFGYILKEIIVSIKDYAGIYTFKEIVTDTYIIFMVLIIIILGIFYFFLDKVIVPLVCKKNYNSNKFYTELVNYKINENEIYISTESSNVTLTKDKIFKINNDKDTIYIYPSLYMSYLIKSRYFENTEQFNKLCDFIKHNYVKK